MMTAVACPREEQLQALSVGALPEEESNELFEHIGDCTQCRSTLETLEDSNDSLVSKLRRPSVLAPYVEEDDCRLAVTKALGALALASDSPESPADGEIPQIVGEYEIIRPLGRGGMGSVYLARHTKLGREVALKVLVSHRLANPKMRERFETEMRAVGRLNHPNIVSAHDAREVDGTAVLITEFIDGWDLGQVVARTGRLAIADACEIARQVADALETISQQELVHRDVKPSNIMLSYDGQVKLLDLGLARWQYGDEQTQDLTGTGQVMGTADYMSPEQIQDSRSVDIRADIYALGCTLFKLLTGRAPFADDAHPTAFAKMTAHVSELPPNLIHLRPDAPRALSELVASMLAKSSSDRPNSPKQIAEQLSEYTDSANLPALAATAQTQRIPGKNVEAATTSASRTRDPSKSWLMRGVPAWLAIATGFAAFALGCALGIIITIRNPDGSETVIKTADGSQVVITEAETAIMSDASNGSPAIAHQNDPTTPLQFAILLNRESSNRTPSVTEAEIVSATQTLHQNSPGNPVETDVGTWFPCPADLSAAVTAFNGGVPYVLASKDSPHFIDWSDIQHHILSAAVIEHRVEGSPNNRQSCSIRIEADPTFAAKMREITERNHRNQLAIISNGSVRAAPQINSTIGAKIEISGTFTEDEAEEIAHLLARGERKVQTVAPPAFTANGTDLSSAIADDTTEFAPLVFGVLVPALKAEFAAELQTTFAANGFDKQKRVTKFGTWYPVDEGVSAPNELVDGGQRYALVSNDPASQIGWAKLKAGITGTMTRSDIGMELQFNAELSKTMEELSAKNLNRQLAILVDSRIVAAPHIRSVISRSAMITGNFSYRYLADCLHGGLVRSTRSEELSTRQKVIVKQKRSDDNLKQLGLAFHNFYSAYRVFPGSSNVREGGRSYGNGVKTYPFSWRVAVLPFIEQNELFEQYRFDEPWDSEHNLTLLGKMPEVFRSPFAADNQAAGETNYVGFVGEHTALGVEGGVSMHDITDGTSNTLLLVETSKSVPWTKPEDISYGVPADAQKLKLFDWQPLRYLRADGSVGTIERLGLDWEYVSKLITRDGGEVIQVP